MGAAPADSTSDWDGSTNAVGTIVTYACTSGDKKYSKCGADGTWSTVDACGDPGATQAPPTATTKKPGKKPNKKPNKKPSKPGKKPSKKPGKKPSKKPGKNPSKKPSKKPGKKPSKKPGK